MTELTNRPPPGTDPRVILAAERTLLAWIRTGIAMMGFGFVLARFGWFLRELAALSGGPAASSTPGFSHVVGTALVALAIVVNVASGVWYVRFVARYRRGESVAHDRLSLGVVLAAVIALFGAALTWYLLRVA